MDEFSIWMSEIETEANAAEARLKFHHSQDVTDRNLDQALRGETVTPTAPRVEKTFSKSAKTARSETTASGAICDYDEHGSLVRCRAAGVSIETFNLDEARKASCRCGQ